MLSNMHIIDHGNGRKAEVHSEPRATLPQGLTFRLPDPAVVLFLLYTPGDINYGLLVFKTKAEAMRVAEDWAHKTGPQEYIGGQLGMHV